MSCYCHNCEKDFHPLGIMRHRKMHIERREVVVITYTGGDTYKHSPEKPNIRGSKYAG